MSVSGGVCGTGQTGHAHPRLANGGYAVQTFSMTFALNHSHSQPQGELRLSLKSPPLPNFHIPWEGVSCRCLFDSAEPLEEGRRPDDEV